MKNKGLPMLALALGFFLITPLSFAQEGQSAPLVAGEGPAGPTPIPVEGAPPVILPADSLVPVPGTQKEPLAVKPPEVPVDAQTEGMFAQKLPEQALHRFGQEFFAPARKRIQEMEKRIVSGQAALPGVEQRDALSGFVGPLEMVTSSVYATIPNRYILSPGDQTTVFYWGKMLDLQKMSLVVDENGDINLPQVGKVSVRGMTLDQYQRNLRSALERVTVKDLELVATLDRLKSIQIFMTGEVFRPGSYAVSAVTTLFNALYASGGPSDLGSLRDIRLLRNQTTIRIDFYDYLLHGDSHADLPLQPGDTIFIPLSERAVSLSGEVPRPGIYELREGENLKTLMVLAGGVKTTGILQKALIRSLSPNKEKILMEVDLSGGSSMQDPSLYDGDSVFVSPILPDLVNNVFLEGKVERPGIYELKEGMRVADLFSDINRPLGEAYLERADIIRLNEDRRTTTLIPVHLDKALEKDPVHNIQLAWMDRVIVYSKFDVAFFPPRVVTLAGAVQRPGNFERSESMTLKDLLVKGGGLMPDAYLDRADLLRYDFTKEITTIIPVDLGKVLAGETAANIPLLDKDIIRIYTMKETQFTPPHTVAVFGAVQRPGTYPRSEKMRLNDLLLAAGGPLPGYYEKMEVARARTEGEIRILSIDLPRLIQGDETQNISLEDEDIVMIKKKSEFFDKPIFITLDGEVKYPGTYPLRTRTDKISDLLKRAGGVTDRANPSGAVFTRKKEYIPSPEQRSDLALVNQVINIVNNLEYERQLARNRFLMIQEQAGMIQTPIGSAAPPIVSTGSASEAAAIGMAPLTAQAAGQTVGGIIGSMETLPSVVSKPRQLGETTLEPSGRIIVNLPEALSDPGGKDDLVLKDGDTLKIPTRTMAVNVIGAVMRPTTVAYEKKRKLEQYINLAGGYTEDANQEKTLVLRLDGSILPVAEVDALEDGDVLYVPPKVMSLEIVERIDKIIDVVKFTLVTAASVGTFIFLVGLFVP